MKKKLVLIKMIKSLFHQMKVSENGLLFLENLKILIVIMNYHVLICIDDDLNLIFDYLMYLIYFIFEFFLKYYI